MRTDNTVERIIHDLSQAVGSIALADTALRERTQP